MTSHSIPESKLQQLELAHADEGHLEDIRHSDAIATDSHELRQGYFISPQLVGSVAAIALSTLASYWAFSPAAAVITIINADIGALTRPSTNSSLFSIVWSTCSAIAIILFGRISDKFGRRWFVIGASSVGFIGGVIASQAKDINTLIGANVMLGLAAGVHTCYSLTVGEICPNRYKFLGVVLCVMPSCISTGFGAYLGFQLAETASWRWIYYIQLIMMGIAVILQVLFYRPPTFAQLHGGQRTVFQEFKRIDHVGAFLMVAGLTLFLLGVSWGGNPLPWTNARILGLVISGGVLLVIFGFWEVYSGVPNPLVPMHFYKDIRGFVCLSIISAVSGTVYLATAIIWPSQVVAIYGATHTDWKSTAWASSTVGFGIWGGIVTLGPLIHVIKHVRIQLIVFMGVSVAFLGALVSCNSGNFNQSAAFSFLATYPAGILELMAGILVQMDSHDSDLGTVFALIFLARTAFGSVMTAIFIAILTSKVPTKIAEFVPAAVEKAGLPASSLPDLFAAVAAGGTPAALAKVPGITPAIEAALGSSLSTAYAAAYAYVYYAAISVGLVGLIACICVKDYDPYFTSHVPRQIYKAGEDKVVTEKMGGENGSEANSVGKEGASQQEIVDIA